MSAKKGFGNVHPMVNIAILGSLRTGKKGYCSKTRGLHVQEQRAPFRKKEFAMNAAHGARKAKHFKDIWSKATSCSRTSRQTRQGCAAEAAFTSPWETIPVKVLQTPLPGDTDLKC